MASTTMYLPAEAGLALHVATIARVCGPDARRGLVYRTVEAVGRVGANVSTVATRAPSISTSATPQTSHGKPIHRTSVPMNVKLAVAPVAEEKAAPSPSSATPTPELVVSSQDPSGASIALFSCERTGVERESSTVGSNASTTT